MTGNHTCAEKFTVNRKLDRLNSLCDVNLVIHVSFPVDTNFHVNINLLVNVISADSVNFSVTLDDLSG